MAIFQGSATAMVTPFNNDGTINYDSFGNMIEYQIANGTKAIFVAVTTGEVSVMSDEDHIAIIKYAVEKVAGRIPVFAGTGSNVTAHAVELSKAAEAVGADGLLVVTPYYNKTTQKGLVKHYTEIAESTKLPIILYSVAGRTGINISVDTCKELAKIPNIIGIKEASGDMSQIAKIAAECCDDNFCIYSGNDDQTLPMLALGAQGVISVLSNVMPKTVSEMCDKFFAGDVAGSREIFLNTLDLANKLFIETNPIPVKTACNLMGMNAGKLIAPLYDMEEKNLEILKEAMRKQGLIK